MSSTGFLMFFIGLFVVLLYARHYLMILLGVEVMLLSTFFLLTSFFSKSLLFQAPFFFLLMMVCMGAYGISLLVSKTRSEGVDFWQMDYLK